jgi:hypothetical protein
VSRFGTRIVRIFTNADTEIRENSYSSCLVLGHELYEFSRMLIRKFVKIRTIRVSFWDTNCTNFHEC